MPFPQIHWSIDSLVNIFSYLLHLCRLLKLNHFTVKYRLHDLSFLNISVCFLPRTLSYSATIPVSHLRKLALIPLYQFTNSVLCQHFIGIVLNLYTNMERIKIFTMLNLRLINMVSLPTYFAPLVSLAFCSFLNKILYTFCQIYTFTSVHTALPHFLNGCLLGIRIKEVLLGKQFIFGTLELAKIKT